MPMYLQIEIPINIRLIIGKLAKIDSFEKTDFFRKIENRLPITY